MRIAVSNIAWEPAEDESVAAMLREFGVDAIEVAPTKLVPEPAKADEAALREIRRTWEGRGFRIVSMQALLFGQPELLLFADDATRTRTIEYLDKIFRFAAVLGAGPLVFGSPKNRAIGDRSSAAVESLAIETFRRIGDRAAAHGVLFCIEPNASEYKCDFITNSAQGIEIVARIAHPAVRLHLDGGVMTLNGEDPEQSIRSGDAGPVHFHISEPYLRPVGGGATNHARLANRLRQIGYAGYASIEMTAGSPDGNIAALRRALTMAVETYREAPGGA